MTNTPNTNGFGLLAAAFFGSTALGALALEQLSDLSYGQALVFAAPIVLATLIPAGIYAYIRNRRKSAAMQQRADPPEDQADSDDNEAELVKPDQSDVQDTPHGTSVTSPNPAQPDPQDVTATSTNIPVIVPETAIDRLETSLKDLDVPDSIADLASYSELLHPWSFYRHVLTAGLLGVVTFILFGWVSASEGPWTEVFTAGPWLLPALWLLWLLGAGFAVLMLIRRHKIWKMRPLVCDPRSGILTIFETGSRLWVIPNSEPDQYPLSEVSIDSPKQTWFEQYVLRDSYTLVLMGEGKPRVIRYVRDIRKIKDIAAAYRSIVTQQRDLLRDLLREVKLLREETKLQLAEQRRANELVAQLLEVNQRVEHTVTQLPRP